MAAAGSNPAEPAPRRVLVVDDSPDNAELLRTFLCLDQHVVHIAHDGLSALEAATHFRPDTVLLDIGLPGMDGLQVARELRGTIGTKLLLIALTGHARPEDREATRIAGCDHHLNKPVDLATLRSILSSTR